ncbi:MAG: ABC transporter ATP-binding protein, partial [Polyangiaceae bacterium]
MNRTAYRVENDRRPPTQHQSSAAPPEEMTLEHVSVDYARGAAPALTDVCVRFESGEVTALVGPNGAGKSTLLRVAAGLVRPSSGRVRIAGRDVSSAMRARLAKTVAFVSQNEAVPSGFPVRDVVAMGRAPHQGRWMRETQEDRDAIARAIEKCDLADLSSRAVETLSGGEQRRVAIARALAQEPRVLLLDEPAAFLDVRHRLALHELLVAVASRDRVACAVATHDLDSVARCASRAVLMRGGRVVAAGIPADVMIPAHLETTFDARVARGVHEASGQPYFVVLQA